MTEFPKHLLFRERPSKPQWASAMPVTSGTKHNGRLWSKCPQWSKETEREGNGPIKFPDHQVKSDKWMFPTETCHGPVLLFYTCCMSVKCEHLSKCNYWNDPGCYIFMIIYSTYSGWNILTWVFCFWEPLVRRYELFMINQCTNPREIKGGSHTISRVEYWNNKALKQNTFIFKIHCMH